MMELLEKYPKAAKLVQEYYLEQLLEGLKEKSLPEEFKEHVRQQGITNETISGIISGNPVLLFSVFDKNGIYIDIDVHIHNSEVGFSYVIAGEEKKDKILNTRKEAEQLAIEEAFNLLERIL